MKNILAIFKEDLKKLFGNVVNGIVTLGLILLPSIFALYNIIACWDVFDNTGNVKVAVANTDEGYQSDLIPLRMNLGEQVISALRSNDQIKWEFVSEEEAIDGAKAGRYYAAVVIPSTFSKDMLTFYSDGGEQARITYYSNQKKNVIAPKVTDQGASSVSYAVNEAFAQSVSEISLSLVHVMANYLDENGADARIVALADHLEATSRVLDNAASAVEVFGAFGNASKDALDSATKLINATQAGFGSIAGSTVGVAEGVSETAEALDSATATFKEALTASTESYEQLAQAAKDAAGALGNTSSAMASSMRMQAEAVSAQIASYQELSGLLRQIALNVPSDVQPVLLAMADRLDSTVKTLEQVRDLLNQSADDLDRANAQAKADIVELEKVSAEAKTELDNLQKTYDQEVGPALEEFERSSKAAAKAFSEGAAVLSEQDPFTIEGSESLESTFNDALGQSAKSADELRSAADQLSSTAEKLREAAMAGDSQTLHDLLSADVEGLAHALAAPVSIERTAVFPSQSFGASMAPLYTTLAIFIGSLLIMVAVKPRISQRMKNKLKDPKPRQLFTGHFLICALLSLAQTTFMALGNLFFLDISVVHPLLFMLVYWFAGLVFTFIIYTLVVSFANLGKAIAVLMLIVQVTACNGSYPLVILPDFVQMISPWMPATHVVEAMRAAMFGIYQNDFWIAMGELALFLVPAALLGYALRKPLEKFMQWYVRTVESTNLIE